MTRIPPSPNHAPWGEGGRTAVSQVDGQRCAVSGVCPHLGGTLAWNPAEQSWDCPLHGSRFDREGHVRQGPAVEDLEPRDVPR